MTLLESGTMITFRVAPALVPYTDRMDCPLWRSITGYLAVASTLSLAVGCAPGSTDPQPSPGSADPITVEVNQSRDQYGKHAILIQLTNTTDSSLTVTSAQLGSSLFEGTISWDSGESLVLPPRQPKSLPAALPSAACGPGAAADVVTASVTYSQAGQDPVESRTKASDPFGVLGRNAGELCLAAEVADIATLALDPALEVAADGSTAVVRLIATPSSTGGSERTLIIESIDETTLLAQVPTDPWPRDTAIGTAGSRELPLRIRPARCDPHAVAEDKVGTLLPLRVRVGEREGLVKVAAPAELRGRIYDFVTAACSP
ncbi:hypothetical protein [Paenarthrobacter nitroguajacolicus]|uniref:hypothetical protein n=1 Tax=Paenarthrobacter nitroguajacolicus TaxID=211146 RepID=UPI00286D3E1A|nr:hypothetical protein [Paenarthrobacter nitroguajacolicus]